MADCEVEIEGSAPSHPLTLGSVNISGLLKRRPRCPLDLSEYLQSTATNITGGKYSVTLDC